MAINKQGNQVFQRFLTFLLGIVISTFTMQFAGAQTKLKNSLEKVPLDKTIVHGRLPNGLQYYIKNVEEPVPKLAMRLYSKTGSNMEDEEQINIAHAVEHMAFKSSENFPNGIEDSPRLNKFNMSFRDFTAYNHSRLTQYVFNAPSGNSEAFKTGLVWFKDIANGLTLAEADINQVRGELRQEFLLRTKNIDDRFAKQKMRSSIFPCVTGFRSMDDFEKEMKSESLRNFYTSWYRPELLAISIVGNIDSTKHIEETIKEFFSTLPSSENHREIKDCDNRYLHSAPRFAVVERGVESDFSKRNSKIDIHLYYRDLDLQNNLHNYTGLQRLIERQMLRSVINKRFREISENYNAPLLHVDDPFNKRDLAPSLEVVIQSEDPGEKKALSKAMLVLKQLELYGVSESEWENEREMQLSYINNRNPRNADYWINEIKKHYNTGEALPDHKKQYLLEWLKNYSRKDFNEYITQFLSKEPEDVGIITPPGKASSYSQSEFRSWLSPDHFKTVAPYKPPTTIPELMTSDQVARLNEGAIRDMGTGSSGSREFRLANGVKVVLYKSTNNGGKMMIQGFSHKGANCFPKEEFHSIVNAPGIIQNSGVGKMDKFQIKRYLQRKGITSINVSTYIDSHESGIQANATIDNLEEVLQLFYWHFTEPNKSNDAFRDWKSTKFESPPEFRDYFRLMAEKLSGDPSVVTNRLGRKSLQKGMAENYAEITDLEVAYNRYQDLFGKAQDFTFIISGDFETDTILPLINKYLGNLPNKTTTCHAHKESPDVTSESYNAIEAPRQHKIKNTLYGVQFLKQAASTDNWKDELKVKALGEITNQMTWKLRFGKGYSLYMIWVGAKKDLNRNQYEIEATLECIPEEYPLIRKEFANIISEIKSGNIPEPLFQKGMNALYSLYDEKTTSNPGVVHQKLYEHYRYSIPWVHPTEIENYLPTITKEDIVNVANEIYQEENFMEFVMEVD